MQKSPCKTCWRKEKCIGSCPKFMKWFSESWAEIRAAAVQKYGPIQGIDGKEATTHDPGRSDPL